MTIMPADAPASVSAKPMTAWPTWAAMGISVQNQPMEELVHALADGDAETRCSGSPVSVGAVSMPPRHAARAHQHPSTWIYVVVLKTGRRGVVTRWGRDLEHEFIHRAGDVLVMPPGIPHAAINLSRWRSVYALELRVSKSVHQDNEVLAQLQHLAELRRPRPVNWPTRAAIRILRPLVTAARRRTHHRPRAGDAPVDEAVESAVSAPSTHTNTGSTTAPGAGTRADPDASPGEDAHGTADRASRDGPDAAPRASVLMGRGMIMDWSNSFPLPDPGRKPVVVQAAQHSTADAGVADEAGVVGAAIDLLITAMAVLRPALDVLRSAAAESGTRPGNTSGHHSTHPSTPDRPL